MGRRGIKFIDTQDILVVARCRVTKMGKGGQKVQISRYKINFMGM